MRVSYEDHMGDDLKVINMARVSFGSDKKSEWAEEPSVYYAGGEYKTSGAYVLAEKDQRLIQFLARGCESKDWNKLKGDVVIDSPYGSFGNENVMNRIRRMPPHWTPFGHCQITLHLKVPIFVARQLDKHQVGFVKSEVSRRYRTEDVEFYEPDVWRKKADNVKQGSSDEGVNDLRFQGLQIQTVAEGNAKLNQHGLQLYHDMLDAGVCPEQARMVLPQSMYTEYYLTGSLYGWANMFIQRSDSHAQKETQEVAQQIAEIIEPLYPVSWKALTQ